MMKKTRGASYYDEDSDDEYMKRSSLLCCCQYRDNEGRVRHMIDCSDLDEGCQYLANCRTMPDEVKDRCLTEIANKIRIPYPGGSVAVPPLLLTTVLLTLLHCSIASFSFTSLCLSSSLYLAIVAYVSHIVDRDSCRNNSLVGLRHSKLLSGFYLGILLVTFISNYCAAVELPLPAAGTEGGGQVDTNRMALWVNNGLILATMTLFFLSQADAEAAPPSSEASAPFSLWLSCSISHSNLHWYASWGLLSCTSCYKSLGFIIQNTGIDVSSSSVAIPNGLYVWSVTQAVFDSHYRARSSCFSLAVCLLLVVSMLYQFFSVLWMIPRCQILLKGTNSLPNRRDKIEKPSMA